MATTKRTSNPPLKGKTPLPGGETAKGKGRRFFLAIIIFVLIAFAAIPAFASLGQYIGDSSTSVVLKPQSDILYVYNSSDVGIPFAQSNLSVAYDMPVNQTTSYIETNLTVAELNDFAVEKIVLNLAYSGNITERLGFGTNGSNFLPVISVNVHNVTRTNFTIQPQYVTGNQTQYLMFQLISNDSAYSFSIQAYGNSGLQTMFGPIAGEDIGYALGGTVIFVLSGVAAIFYDIDFRRKK